MKQLGELVTDVQRQISTQRQLNEPSNQTQPTSHFSPSLSLKWVERIFVRLEGIYGHLWTSRHANEERWAIAKIEWADTLGDLNENEIKLALMRCRSGEQKMPPTLPQFREFARPTKEQKFARDEWKEYTPTKLTAPINRGLAMQTIAEMKQKLGMKPAIEEPAIIQEKAA